MSAVADARVAEYVGHRPCPARRGYLELVVRVDDVRLSWCFPHRAEPVPARPAARVELQWRASGLRITERDGDGPAELIGVNRAIARLDAGATLVVDSRLVDLHA